MIKIEVHSTRAVIRSQEPLTVGLRGATARFSFGEPWKPLIKAAVFRQGEKTVTVADIGPEVTIPWEVLTQAGLPVQIGIYGTDSTGAVAIPTVWATTQPVRPGTDPEGDPSTEPTPGLWEQLQGKMGSLEQLQTDEKTSLVGAINEANKAVCLVTVTHNGDGTYRANKTMAELEAAWISGKALICCWPNDEIYLPLTLKARDEYYFVATAQNTEYVVRVDRYGTHCSTIVLATDQSKLPNPNKLIFAGAVEAEYDGSNELEVQIPSKTSELENDIGFLTKAPVSSVNGQTGDVHITIPDKVSQLANDMGYLTKAPVTSVNGQTGDVTVPTAVKVTVTQQADGSYDADLHSEEIVEANDAGKMVYCQNGYRVLTLLYATYSRCIFGCVHAGYVHTVTISASGVSVASAPLASGGGSGGGADGITPHIGDNGNWFIGETDTGMPSRGEVGPTGVHVGPDAPEDDAVHVWVDTDEDSNAELPSGGDGGYYTPVITQTEAGKAELSWTASKAGMPTVAPQSVMLPQGPRGEKGEPGADGNDGPKGVPGADGKSAYQYALDGGYTGTEEEFAEKLADCSSYTLPIATSETLGGVKPVAKSDDMTQSVGVDADGGLWTKLGATTGTGGVFKTIADFTTTEIVSEIQIPIDTDELVELCHSAKELRVLIHIEKDTSDTTTVDGNIEFGANPGWYAKFATVDKVIPAATTDWQNHSDTYIVAFCDAGQYVPSPVLIAKATQNAAATVEATQVNWISPDISYLSKGHFFYVRGTQNMGAGTRVVLEVAT